MLRLLKVISTFDDSKGLVDASGLEHLLKHGAVRAFERSGGWVRIGRDPIRRNTGIWKGPDRRKLDQNSE